MANPKLLEERLKEIGCNFRFFARPELKELGNVLLDNEVVEHCVIGTYEGGFALLVATDQRVLLIDKKPLYLTLEDTRYDMITEVDFNHRLMDGNIYIRTPNKALRFVAYNQGRLRKMFHFVQTRVMEIRQHYQQAAAQQALAQQRFEAEQYGLSAAKAQQLNFNPYAPQANISKESVGQEVAFARVASQQVAPPAPTLQSTISHAMPHAYPVVAPIISAYTRLPMMSRQRRFLGQRAVNTNSLPTGL
jgi:hypothetical protein